MSLTIVAVRSEPPLLYESTVGRVNEKVLPVGLSRPPTYAAAPEVGVTL